VTDNSELNPANSLYPAQIDDAWLDQLREDILRHFESLGLPNHNGNGQNGFSKEAVRTSHAYQRQELLERVQKALRCKWDQLLAHFADGLEVNPAKIDPELVSVNSDDETGTLFRFATLLWSVPVSSGYGLRMRYLVRDRANNKLIGLFALGDPVFNLQARDKWIGWNANDRRARLVNVMDAYVVGAVPPYSQLLGGKLVASLIGSAEVNQAFSARYKQTCGIISGEAKAAQLVLVTVTSALGRSSLYNRLKLTNPVKPDQYLAYLQQIGETRGYGHFHLSNSIFERMRHLLAMEDHKYANSHQFGQGPNWRWRVIRVGLKRLGLDEDLLRHGILREIYVMPLASDCREFLRGEIQDPHLQRPTTHEIATVALNRWVIPRSERMPDYRSFKKEQLLDLMGGLNKQPPLFS